MSQDLLRDRNGAHDDGPQDIAKENAIKLLQYAINKSVGIDPQLVMDTLTGRLTQADLGLPILEGTPE